MVYIVTFKLGVIDSTSSCGSKILDYLNYSGDTDYTTDEIKEFEVKLKYDVHEYPQKYHFSFVIGFAEHITEYYPEFSIPLPLDILQDVWKDRSQWLGKHRNPNAVYIDSADVPCSLLAEYFLDKIQIDTIEVCH
jgi:hypothetical protein